MNNKERMNELDALRGIAAVAVVIYHYTTRYNELFPSYSTSSFSFPYGKLGVHIFFILSGYVIFLTLKNVTSYKDFIKKRAIRLYPAYIFSVILTFSLVSTFGLENRETTFFEALINLSMLQSFIPGIGHVDGAYWSLSVEITFYILISIMLYFNKIHQIYTALLIWLLGSMLFFMVTIYMDNHLITSIYHKSISDYSHLFIAGILFNLLQKAVKKKYILLLLSTLIYQFILSDIITFLVISSMYLVFWKIISGKLYYLNNKFLVFLGSISYSLYLIHQNIGYLILNYLHRIGFESSFWIFLPLVFTICIAYFITEFVERPIINYLKRKMSSQEYKRVS